MNERTKKKRGSNNSTTTLIYILYYFVLQFQKFDIDYRFISNKVTFLSTSFHFKTARLHTNSTASIIDSDSILLYLFKLIFLKLTQYINSLLVFVAFYFLFPTTSNSSCKKNYYYYYNIHI
jgi:hypothetical protein